MLEAGTPAFVEALDQAVIALMIEKDPAVENLEDLLSVEGVNMVQFGQADYAMSIGPAGQLRHPRVRAAEEHVISTALRMGISLPSDSTTLKVLKNGMPALPSRNPTYEVR